LRRARRAAESIGEVSCDVVTPTPKELPLLLAEAFAVEAKGWKGRAGTALACDKIRGEFYRRFTAAACELGILRLCFLRIGGEAVAMQIAVQMADAFWLLKVGYDEKYRNCSPGNLLIWETIRYASSERLSTYEFIGLDEQWIHAFTDVVQPTLTIEVYPASILGGAVLARDAFLSLRRKTTKFIKKSINEKNA
jgi:CelD/BcsL family acetyltransferase involved in cellulose biosynthesis